MDKAPVLPVTGFRENSQITTSLSLTGLTKISGQWIKRENYIKRCIAIPGDTLEVRDAEVYINGKQNTDWPGQQIDYIVHTDGTSINQKILDELDITEYSPSNSAGVFRINLTKSGADAISRLKNVKTIEPDILSKGLYLKHFSLAITRHSHGTSTTMAL
jgi:signal peptidase I